MGIKTLAHPRLRDEGTARGLRAVCRRRRYRRRPGSRGRGRLFRLQWAVNISNLGRVGRWLLLLLLGRGLLLLYRLRRRSGAALAINFPAQLTLALARNLTLYVAGWCCSLDLSLP